LGFLWTLLNPFVFIVVYTRVFSRFLRLGIPKLPAFLLTRLFPWMWFSESVMAETSCLVDHAMFLRNAVFPAQVLPVVSVGVGMMNYMFSLPVLFILLAVYEVPLDWTVLALPLVMAVQFMLILSIVYFTSTLNVFLRDLRYIIQHGLLVGFFPTLIMYDLSFVPARFQWLLKINPMTIVIDSYRRLLFYGTWPHWRNLGFVLALALVLLVLGRWSSSGEGRPSRST
ncbi:MAG: ABC transporter permease, partial [Candidatus Bipolaricaulota bacterium]|nr:ABC transporter permease [Candidatus Bipolaricaulota bacterium]MDW8127480.1 ABC transporter permease [Candidatus Bipolaricaulota bacterium]